MSQSYFICDMRRTWRGEWALTFWRPNDGGYAHPLCWAGRYDQRAVVEGGDHYHRFEGRALTRFAVPCEVAERLAVAPPHGKVDGDAGPVVLNTPENRKALRKAAFVPAMAA